MNTEKITLVIGMESDSISREEMRQALVKVGGQLAAKMFDLLKVELPRHVGGHLGEDFDIIIEQQGGSDENS